MPANDSPQAIELEFMSVVKHIEARDDKTTFFLVRREIPCQENKYDCRWETLILAVTIAADTGHGAVERLPGAMKPPGDTVITGLPVDKRWKITDGSIITRRSDLFCARELPSQITIIISKAQDIEVMSRPNSAITTAEPKPQRHNSGFFTMLLAKLGW